MINHKSCQTVEISKIAINIKSSAELKDLNKKIEMLKKAFNGNLNKTEIIRSTIQRNYSEAIDEMKKLRDEFERKMSETENQVELVKVEDLKRLESVTDTCNVAIEEIHKMTSNIKTLQNKGDDESVFISIKKAESELSAMEESLTKLRSDNTAREYTFEPDKKLKALLSEIKVLGPLSCRQSTHLEDLSAKCVSITKQMPKKPTHVKDITVSDSELEWHGSVMMSKKQILITDKHNDKVKLINTNNGSIVSEIQLSDTPENITKVSSEQVAVTLPNQNKIQILSFKQNIVSIKKAIKVDGMCYGIAYNNTNKTFIVSYCDPGKVEIINLAGTVLRIIETNQNGSNLFDQPEHVALCPNMSGIYVSDFSNHSVTLLTIYGDGKAVFKDNGLKYLTGICVHKSGLVYVVGKNSNTVHQLDPDSGESKLLLDQQDGLNRPYSISYCDVEDKIYVGMYYKKHIKVFKLR